MISLYPHQDQAAAFIAERDTSLLADVPGLGKTYSALAGALASKKHAQGDWVGIVPKNVVRQWKASVENFCPQKTNINFYTYESAKKYIPQIQKASIIFFDEFHKLKDIKSQRFQLLAPFCQDPSKKIIGLTGTPLYSYPKDLFAQLYCLRLIDMDQYKAFINYYCDPVLRCIGGRYFWDDRGCNKKNIEHLRLAFQKYILRRSFKDVGFSMPLLTVTDQYVDLGTNLDSSDIATYRNANADFGAWYLETQGKEAFPLVKFTILRRLLAKAKIPTAVDQAAEELVEGSDTKMIIFSDFRDCVESMYVTLMSKGIKAFLIEGGQTDNYRNNCFAEFSAYQGPAVIVATLDSLDLGVNLQSANRLFFLDISFKPASFVQAVCRAWRMGQQRPVSVVRFLVQDENGMDEILSKNNFKKEEYMNLLGVMGEVSLSAN